MNYTQAMARDFWYEFDDYFKYKAASNGLGAKYQELGGYTYASDLWMNTRPSKGGNPEDFINWCSENKNTIVYLANEQKIFFNRYFQSSLELIVKAFQDFAFGILSTPTRQEPVHTMNAGMLYPKDYLSWHGFIEACIAIEHDIDFWKSIRWVNGMAFELQAKARPQERYPNQNQPLPDTDTKAITTKWENRSEEEISVEFENYDSRPYEWIST